MSEYVELREVRERRPVAMVAFKPEAGDTPDLYCICSDGTLWRLKHDEDGWDQEPSIPQPDMDGP